MTAAVAILPADLVRRARRRVALAVALVAALTLLCCGGGVSAFFLGQVGEEENSVLSAAFDCGGNILPLGADLPAFQDYSPQQISHALTIIQVGDDKEVPVRGWVIAIATALVESNLKNYANDNRAYPAVRRISMALPHDAVGHDHDSVGLFQQRPVEGDGGWGTVRELMTPEISARKFYDALLKIDNWQQLELTVAAQRVQRSAYPHAYRAREPLATEMVNALSGGSARVAIGEPIESGCADPGQIASSGWTLPVPAKVGSGFRTPERPNHQGVDLSLAKGEPIRAAAAGVVSVVKCNVDRNGRQTCDVDGYPGKGGCGWMVEIVHAERVMTRYCHLVRRPDVRVGQQVKAGDVIGRVGSSGNSSGPHLHFEVHLNNDRTSNGAVDPVQFMRARGAPLNGDS